MPMEREGWERLCVLQGDEVSKGEYWPSLENSYTIYIFLDNKFESMSYISLKNCGILKLIMVCLRFFLGLSNKYTIKFFHLDKGFQKNI